MDKVVQAVIPGVKGILTSLKAHKDYQWHRNHKANVSGARYPGVPNHVTHCPPVSQGTGISRPVNGGEMDPAGEGGEGGSKQWRERLSHS